jgi:5'-nucleotidase
VTAVTPPITNPERFVSVRPNPSRRAGKIAVAAAAGAGLAVTPLAVLAPPAHAAPVDITIVGTNDFHGRLLPDRNIPGAAKYAGALNAIRAENPNTVFAAAGDLIGATTFESFINQDKPTIDILNEMGLDVSAVGNHELDQGYDDLTKRVMAPFDETTNPKGGAQWQYIAANLDEPGDADLIAPSWTEDVGGVTVGFVGAVTEALPSLVSPAGIAGITVEDIVASTNEAADDLVADGADVVVMLVHEGAPSTDCASMDDNPSSAFGEIVTGANDNIDAIISGHTHLPYNCEIDGRPVVSAGQYGSHLNRLDFTVDDTTGEVSAVTRSLIDVNAGTFTADAEVQAIVDAAKAAAEGPGSVELGEIGAPFSRAQWLKPNEAGAEPDRTDNRGGESTLGNVVAEAQRWATSAPERGGAQIAFMNPGGLRTDMLGVEADGYPESLTYRQAANVQPFANTLVNMTLTGAQIRQVLEEQWQPAGATRPFLRLGTSTGFEYTYDPTAAPGARIGAMWLNDEEVTDDGTYSVTVNSFLASGGDNFPTLAQGTDVRDTGMVDLQAMVDYMAAHAVDQPLAPDFSQHAVGVRYPGGESVAAGGRLELELSSLAMTFVSDVQDKRVAVKLGEQQLGGTNVDNSLQLAGSAAEEGGFDEAGKATLTIRIPKKVSPGMTFVRVIGQRTGTDIKVPIQVLAG